MAWHAKLQRTKKKIKHFEDAFLNPAPSAGPPPNINGYKEVCEILEKLWKNDPAYQEPDARAEFWALNAWNTMSPHAAFDDDDKEWLWNFLKHSNKGITALSEIKHGYAGGPLTW